MQKILLLGVVLMGLTATPALAWDDDDDDNDRGGSSRYYDNPFDKPDKKSSPYYEEKIRKEDRLRYDDRKTEAAPWERTRHPTNTFSDNVLRQLDER